jgi:hypothetical protein
MLSILITLAMTEIPTGHSESQAHFIRIVEGDCFFYIFKVADRVAWPSEKCFRGQGYLPFLYFQNKTVLHLICSPEMHIRQFVYIEAGIRKTVASCSSSD